MKLLPNVPIGSGELRPRGSYTHIAVTAIKQHNLTQAVEGY